MPKIDLLLTNGGYGSIQIALAHGVPVVAIGNTEEKPEIANRVQWAGVGIGLKVLVPTEKQIRNAVRRVISTPTYAARAQAIRYEMAGLDAATTGAELLEELAGNGDELARSAWEGGPMEIFGLIGLFLMLFVIFARSEEQA